MSSAAVALLAFAHSWLLWIVLFALGILALYLARLNYIFNGTPDEIQEVDGSRWTPEELRKTYDELSRHPLDYHQELPPKLNRRYIVTGGHGLVGGHIVLQLLARGQSPKSIRVLDIREPERNDMRSGPATEVDFVQVDITSKTSVDAAFAKAWDPSIASLPLTVFHTAAVIIASDRSKHFYAFPEAVNVTGTKHVLAAARQAGADIFSATSSGSISIRPVKPFVSPLARRPGNFGQVMDERDFYKPLRPRDDFFANYPISKAVAERLVCDENGDSFRTGSIRPANGVYGNPTDNIMGGPLSKTIFPVFTSHIVQNHVHGANVAIAHLHHEAVLQKNGIHAGRPYVVTDPNPPITYGDIYTAIKTLSVHPLIVINLPPVLVLLLAYCFEWYSVLPYEYPLLKYILPPLKGDLVSLKPGIFSICTHLLAADTEARKPVEERGLGYKGVITTMQGMALEILEWNREHQSTLGKATKRAYTSSISLAEELINVVGNTVAPQTAEI